MISREIAGSSFVFVPVGGAGSRFAQIAEGEPKSMSRVNGLPLLESLLRTVVNTLPASPIYLGCRFDHQSYWIALANSLSKTVNAEVRCVYDGELAGTVSALWNIDFGDRERAVVLYPDVVWGGQLPLALSSPLGFSAAVLGIQPSTLQSGRFVSAVVQGGRVMSIRRTNEQDRTCHTLALAPFFTCPVGWLEERRQGAPHYPSDLVDDLLIPAVSGSAPMYTHFFDWPVIDIGTGVGLQVMAERLAISDRNIMSEKGGGHGPR